MFSRWSDRLRHTLGLRLAVWYSLVFVGSSLALIGLTYFLLATALRLYDREAIQTTLLQSVAAYVRGGVNELMREIRTTQIATPGPLFVRTMSPSRSEIFVSMPDEWRRFDLSQLPAPRQIGQQTWTTLRMGETGDVLEIASVRLPDGTLFQVGKGSERRTQLLARFRRLLVFDFVTIILIALAGGAVLNASALRPVRTLANTVRSIMRTGRTDARVPEQDTGDALGELGTLVNAMLARIDAVVEGMRGALDNVAHDLRTPMARLRGIAETALVSDDPATLRNALGDCLEESDRVIAMLNTLMDISEAETGTMKLRPEPTDLTDLIRQTVDLYEDLADDRGVHISTTTEGDLTIPVDRNRIRQVLANLLDNAVKYTPRDGRVEIAARREGGEAVLSVSDTGVGIPADELPHIWERLYRGDKSRTERGLGLGLSFVKAIVQAHGGRVDVRSRPSQGSTFELRLPGSGNPRT